MRKLILLTVIFLAAVPGFADKRLDDAVAKAEELFQKGKPEEALKVMTKVASQDPSTEAQVALARFQERAGSLDEAADTLQKAVAAASPGNKGLVLASLASLDLRRGTGKDALAHATDAVKAQESVITLAALARAQARVGDGASALTTADKAVQADPSSAVAHEARGEALLAQGRFDDAAASERKALEIDPKFVRARVRLAEALIGQKKAAEAVTEAKKATDADPKLGEAFSVLGLALLAVDPKANWNDAIEQAQQAATVLETKNPAVHVAVGRILESRGNLDQAANSYRRAVEADPAYVPAREALIQTEFRLGNADLALQDAQKLVVDAPRSGVAQYLVGRALYKKNDWAAAAAALEKATQYSPNHAEAHALLGTAYQFLHRPSDAVASYKRAVELDPQNLDYRSTYGLLLGITGQQPAGIAELKTVVSNPAYKDAAAWINLGWVYRNSEPRRPEEATAAYRKALEIDPKNAQSALGLGWAFSYAKDWDQAMAAFQKTVQLDPKLAGEADDGIGWCYFFKKDFAGAKASVDKAAGEGINDTRLKESIDRVEKAIKAGEEEKARKMVAETEGPREQQHYVNLPELVKMLKAGTPKQKIQAAHEMVGAGKDAVPHLCYFLQKEGDLDVRQAEANSLGAIGPSGGRESCDCLMKASAQPYPNITGTPSKEEVADQMRWFDLQRHMKEILAKLGCH